MMSKKAIFSILLVSAIVFQAYRMATDTGYFVNIQPKSYGTCKKMQGPPGAEDINVDRINKVAFVSSGNGRDVFEGYRTGRQTKAANGDIWLLDLADKNSVPRRLNVDIGSSFHPHGIDLLTMENGNRELYVVNHPSYGVHEILIFAIEENHDLKLKERVHYPELISPNDIKAIESGKFFATNDHGSARSSIMYTLEDYLGLSRTSVTYYDGSTGSFLIKGLKSANGITLSDDQQTLYVAEALGRKVKRFKRGESIRDWQFVDSISLTTSVDNLEWGDDGKLLSGAHPKIFDLLAHFENEQNQSPSEVVAIDVSSSPMIYETIYMNDGREMSGSSVATMLDGEMLIGSVLERHFLRCSKS